MQINKYINLAYNKALECYGKKLDVPVGCVIIDENFNILAVEHNKCVELNNPTLHAEMLAISAACAQLNSGKLNGCSVYTTLEPCLMCTGALMNARVKNIYFGAYDKQYGALESNNVILKHNFNYRPNVYGGLMELECGDLVNNFFAYLRQNS